MSYCPDAADDIVTWTSTPAGSSASGQCIAGYGGNPTRVCSSTGIWLIPTGIACSRTSLPRRVLVDTATDRMQLTVVQRRSCNICRADMQSTAQRFGDLGGHRGWHLRRRGHVRRWLRPVQLEHPANPHVQHRYDMERRFQPVHSYAAEHDLCSKRTRSTSIVDPAAASHAASLSGWQVCTVPARRR